jgi:hypothetical protein
MSRSRTAWAVSTMVACMVCIAAYGFWRRTTRMRTLDPAERERMESASVAMRVRLESQLNQFRTAVRTGFDERRELPTCGPDSGGHDPDWVPMVVHTSASDLGEIVPAGYRTNGITPDAIDRRLAELRRPFRADRIEPALQWFHDNPPRLVDQAVFVMDPTGSNADGSPGEYPGTVLLFDALAGRCVCAARLTVTMPGTATRGSWDDRIRADVRGVFERRVPN